MIDQAAEKGLNREKLLRLRLQVAAREGDLQKQRRLLQGFLEGEDTPPAWALTELAAIDMSIGDGAAACRAVERVVAVNPGDAKARRLAAAAAFAAGNVEGAAGHYEALLKMDPQDSRLFARFIQVSTRGSSMHRAVELFRDALDRGIADPLVIREALQLPLPPDVAKRLVSWARSVGPQASPDQRTTASAVLSWFGEPLPRHPLNAGSGSHFPDWADDAPRDAELKRPLIEENPEAEVMVARAEFPVATVVVFTGLGDRMILPIKLFDRYLAALNVNAIYLRDFSRLLYNQGIASIADDFDGAVEYLKSLLEELNAERVVTIGNSAGGYAALRYGLALHAAVILGFGAPTNLTKDFLADDGRARIIANRLQNLPGDALDIRPMVRAARGQTRIHLLYGETMRQDERHALYLRGEPGVMLHPIPGAGEHAVVGLLAQQGKLMSLLRQHLLAEYA